MGGRLSYPGEVNLNGKIAIVTGGNTGIGYETAKAISFMGAHTIIACRSEERATQVKGYDRHRYILANPLDSGAMPVLMLQAIDRIKEEVQAVGKEANVEFMKLDLGSLESTKNFIERFKQKNLPLHILICNAGIGFAQQGSLV